MGQLLAGAAQVNLTPPLPATLGGMFLKYKTDIVLDPLFAESLALSDGNTFVILVSCDLVAITESSTARIREIVQNETGIQACQIHISATHTHTGIFQGYINVFKTQEQTDEDNVVLDFIEEKIASAAILAFQNLRPARMGYGSGIAERCCFNRRYIMSNGRCLMNPRGVGRPDRLMVEGPVD